MSFFTGEDNVRIDDNLDPLFDMSKDEFTIQGINDVGEIGGSFGGGLSGDLQDMPLATNVIPSFGTTKMEATPDASQMSVKGKNQLKRRQSQPTLSKGQPKRKRRTVAKSEDNLAMFPALQPMARDLSRIPRSNMYNGKVQLLPQGAGQPNPATKGLGVPIQPNLAPAPELNRRQSAEFLLSPSFIP